MDDMMSMMAMMMMKGKGGGKANMMQQMMPQLMGGDGYGAQADGWGGYGGYGGYDGGGGGGCKGGCKGKGKGKKGGGKFDRGPPGGAKKKSGGGGGGSGKGPLTSKQLLNQAYNDRFRPSESSQKITYEFEEVEGGFQATVTAGGVQYIGAVSGDRNIAEQMAAAEALREYGIVAPTGAARGGTKRKALGDAPKGNTKIFADGTPSDQYTSLNITPMSPAQVNQFLYSVPGIDDTATKAMMGLAPKVQTIIIKMGSLDAENPSKALMGRIGRASEARSGDWLCTFCLATGGGHSRLLKRSKQDCPKCGGLVSAGIVI